MHRVGIQDENLCALCKNTRLSSWLSDEGNHFCCHGCLAVYNILKTKGELDQGVLHPLVKTAISFGLINNEELISKDQKDSRLETIKLYLDIEGLWCPSCAEIICLVLNKLKGVAKCTVDFTTDLAFIEYHPLHISRDQILEQISSLGYIPGLIEDEEKKKKAPKLKFQLAFAAFLSINLMMLSSPIYVSYFLPGSEDYGYLFALLSLIFAIPAFLIAIPILKRALQQVRFGFIGMEALVTIGFFTAFILSCLNLFKGSYHVYFDSMSVVLAFVFLGKSIESEAKFSAKESLLKLMRATPKRARKRFSDGRAEFVPIKEIEIGDIVLAHTGEKIALDGEVIEGEASVDESLMTGEARPVLKNVGSKVIGGTLIQGGYFAFKVLEKVGALQKIVDAIEEDLHKKREHGKIIDTISELFVPIVFFIALGAFFMGALTSLSSGFDRMLSVILISCPCAIGIAVPMVESSLLTALSRLGVIVRNRRALSLMESVDIFLFDKTGTITEGKFEVVQGLDQFTKEERALIKSAARSSLHPLALAITRAIAEKPVEMLSAKEIAGLGIESGFLNTNLFMGSREFLRLKGIDIFAEEKTGAIVTEVCIAIVTKTGIKKAILILDDQVKKEASELIKQLKPLKTVLISGDGESTVSLVAGECGFDEWRARYNPLEKRAFVEALQKKGHVVAMVGDGINDAPSLTLADIGISVVSASDISMHVSDMLLTRTSLLTIDEMRKVLKRGKKIIRQNLFWAFFYNILGILMAFLGLLLPLYAAFAMAASSLICVFNAKRI